MNSRPAPQAAETDGSPDHKVVMPKLEQETKFQEGRVNYKLNNLKTYSNLCKEPRLQNLGDRC